MEPTSKDEGKKKVLRRNIENFVPIILGVAWRYILANIHRDVHRDVHSPPF